MRQPSSEPANRPLGSAGTKTVEEDDPASAQEERVRIVILVRWALIATAVLSAATGVPAHALMEPSVKMASPAGALAGLATWIVCNAFCHLYYKRLFRLKWFLYGQILLDLVLQAPFLYYSGGVFSYGWMQYPVIVVDAALILPRKMDAWLVAALGCLLAAGFAIVEGAGWVRPAAETSISATVIRNVPSIVDRVPWTFGVMLLAAFLGTYLMASVRERERRLRRLADRDGLTNLYNHSRFVHQLQSEVERARRYGDTLSVFMMDLDGFKDLNDSLGHVAGDRALKAVAEILLSNTRRSDTEPAYDIDVPFRYGGDEFAVIVPNTPAQTAMAIEGGPNAITSAGGAVVAAERLRALVARTMEKEGLTTSIGVADYPLHGDNADELVIAADTALYRAKRMGGNCVVVAGPLKKAPEAAPPGTDDSRRPQDRHEPAHDA